MINLSFIGDGAAFNTKAIDNSAYFTRENNLFLIDCGEDIFKQLVNQNILQNIKNIYVIITHMHSDHIGSLPSLILYCKFVLKIDINIIFPDSDKLIQCLTLMGIDQDIYKIYSPSLDMHYTINGLNLEAALTTHVKQINCFSYLISDNDETIYYSGDSIELPYKALKLMKFGLLDRIYQDVCNSNTDDSVHLFIDDLYKFIPEKYHKNIYCMHLDNTLYQENIRKKYDFNFI